MSFRPRIGDVVLALCAVLLIIALAHKAAVHAESHSAHAQPAKAARWQHRA